jgi:hypothetical protein
MTAQASNKIDYNKATHHIVISRGEGLFDPEQLGIVTMLSQTNLSRGYISHYEVSTAGQLYLRSVSLSPRDLPPPSVYGVAPRLVFGLFEYRFADRRTMFNGAMIACHRPVDEPVGTDGTVAPWNFQTVVELVFRDGSLVEHWDHSEAISHLASRETLHTHDGRTLDLLRQIYRSRELREKPRFDPTMIALLRKAFRNED